MQFADVTVTGNAAAGRLSICCQVDGCTPRCGGSHVSGLHHEDYYNTVQMGPSCNRLGWLDWTTEGGGGSKVG